jgi:tetratricopeptide (TPR) repeat protein
MNKKQIVVSIAVVAIVGYLYSLPLKVPATTSSEQHSTGTAAPAQHQAAIITVDMVSGPAKTIIGTGLSANITDLEGKLKNAASDADKLSLQKQLAKAWDDVNQPAPAAFYYQAIARQQNTAQNWISAGSHFNDAYKLTQDTTAQPFFDASAVAAFQNAMKLDSASLDAKTGLGIAYVNGGGMPMQGIALLLGVVSKDPNNLKANLNLGLFSMKSGQFEKAVLRFKTVIAQKPEVEPYFYLAESYRQLGMRKEAISAYEECKQMMPDTAFDQKIDGYIKELKN